MVKGQMRLFFWTVLLTCFCSLFSYAQTAIKSSVDRGEILIGEQFKMKVEINVSGAGPHIQWPALDSLQHFELINSKTDSAYANSQLSAVTQTYTFTSFDSGKWVLPSFLVTVLPGRDNPPIKLFTDSVPLTVSFSASDTTGQLRDIKTIREVETDSNIWYWVAGGILLLLIIAAIIWYYRKRQKKVISPILIKSNLSPYDEAMAELKNLQQYNFSDPGDTRIVHTKLADILKRYYSRLNNEQYLSKTTGDFLLVLKSGKLHADMLSKTAASLRIGDAVKFAKYLPPEAETGECIKVVKELIDSSKNQNAIPKAVTSQGK